MKIYTMTNLYIEKFYMQCICKHSFKVIESTFITLLCTKLSQTSHGTYFFPVFIYWENSIYYKAAD